MKILRKSPISGLLALLAISTTGVVLEAAQVTKSTATGKEWTSLMTAIEAGDLKTVQSLVPHKIKADEQTRGHRYLFSVAKFHAKDEVAKYLAWQAIIPALENGQLDVVKAIVPAIIPSNAKTRGGRSLVAVAQFHNKNNIVGYLQSLGAANGQPVLSVKIVPVQAQAVATQKDWDSLIKAVMAGDLATVQAIVPSKIQPNSTTRNGRSVVDIAKYEGQAAITDYLLKLGSGQVSGQASGTIEFYNAGQPYYEFTNFYRPSKAIKIDGLDWPTTEHYFQAQKFPGRPDIQKQIRMAASPRAAFDLARQHNQFKRQDWEQVKDDIMLNALRAKFTQDDGLKKLLLGTGKATLVEASPVDAYWGYGPNKDGLNILGYLLMNVRAELQQGKIS